MPEFEVITVVHFHKVVEAANETEAEATILQRAKEQGEPCHYEQVGDRWVVYRTRDRKVMKSINYFKPNLTQFFTDEEIEKARLGV